VVPETAILVIGHDHRHAIPLGALPYPAEQFNNMQVAANDVRKAGMLAKATHWFVEGNLRQISLLEVPQKIIAVLEMLELGVSIVPASMMQVRVIDCAEILADGWPSPLLESSSQSGSIIKGVITRPLLRRSAGGQT
jgi:hypothetical protein